MYSAFQNNAFQNNAFQITNSGSTPPVQTIVGGHFIPTKHKNRRILSNVNVIYKAAQSLPRKETKALRDAIAEFVAPEIARIAELPDIAKVDYAAIEANAAAYEKFAKAIDALEKRMEMQIAKEQEDDDLMLVSIISLLIH